MLRVAKSRTEATEAGIVSWQSITQELRGDRDQLRAELRAAEVEHKAKLRELSADYDQQLQNARTRITQLETEVDELYRRLVRQSGPQ